MSLTDVIDVFATGTYDITRVAAGTYASGIWVGGSSSMVQDVVASVQPAQPVSLVADAGGRMHTGTWVIYTKTALQPWRDSLVIEGETCVVISCATWRAFGGTHYVAYAATQQIP